MFGSGYVGIVESKVNLNSRKTRHFMHICRGKMLSYSFFFFSFGMCYMWWTDHIFNKLIAIYLLFWKWECAWVWERGQKVHLTNRKIRHFMHLITGDASTPNPNPFFLCFMWWTENTGKLNEVQLFKKRNGIIGGGDKYFILSCELKMLFFLLLLSPCIFCFMCDE